MLQTHGALTNEEKTRILIAAQHEKTVLGIESKFFERPYDLKIGNAALAARGLEDRLQVDHHHYHDRIGKGLDGIEEEVKEFCAKLPESESREILEMFDYVLNQRTSQKEYPNGITDVGRDSVRFSYFLTHKQAQDAKLSEAEVFALRLYTTLIYKYMNGPLRDDNRYRRGLPCPLPVTTYFAEHGIKKLRAIHAPISEIRSGTGHEGQPKVLRVLWRGMRNVKITGDFETMGGTELAFMSTTTDLSVAVRYSLSHHSVLLKIVVPDFMSLGADLRWLSVFPAEAEVLYPPLTYLRPTGKADHVTVDREGAQINFTVVEVIPSFS